MFPLSFWSVAEKAIWFGRTAPAIIAVPPVICRMAFLREIFGFIEHSPFNSK
jgi:hypothetical protein